MAINEKKVFISYSRQDTDIVYPFVQLLRAIRPDLVFYDQLDLIPGKKWEPQISLALDQADIIVLFWCEHSARSKYVEKEYKFAFKMNKSVLTVLIDATPLKKSLRAYQFLDFKTLNYHNRYRGLQAISEPLGDTRSFDDSSNSFSCIHYISISIGILIITAMLEKYTSIQAVKYIVIIVVSILILLIIIYFYLIIKARVTKKNRNELSGEHNSHVVHSNAPEIIANSIAEKLEEKFPIFP